MESFSHTLLGSFVLCLPIGLLTLWIFRQIRDPLIATLPNPHRDAALSFRPWRTAPLAQIILSLLLGSWLHSLWDLFTHDHSWLMRRGLLSWFRVADIPPNRVLWLLSTLIGTAIVLIKYSLLVRKQTASTEVHPPLEHRAYIFWLGILVFPITSVVPLTLVDPTFYHGAFLRLFAMYYFSCCYITLVVVGFVIRYRQRRNVAEET